MRFVSSISLALVLGCAACSAAPPNLPADTTGMTRTRTLSLQDFNPADQSLSCSDIQGERGRLRQAMVQADNAVRESRSGNQAALFLVGVLALPVVDYNQDDKALMEKARLRLDTLAQLSAVRKCPRA